MPGSDEQMVDALCRGVFQRPGHEQDALTLPTTVAVDGQRLERWIWKMLVQESPKLPGVLVKVAAILLVNLLHLVLLLMI